MPFWGIHVASVVGVLVSGWSWSGFALAMALYYARMFFLTAGYHRYFAHRSFKTSRAFQLILAIGGTLCLQKGVLWWASHHRRHHRFSDGPRDVHSPRHGFWWSHMGWILAPDWEATDLDAIRDFARYPELRWLNRHFLLPPIVLAFTLFGAGGWWALLWGFLVSTTLLWHGTFIVNSLAHRVGGQRYDTGDDSRNNGVIALLTMGEGWHNNHHHYQSSARQGFFWWEIDLTYYLLRVCAWLGLVRDLRRPPGDRMRSGRSAMRRRAAGALATIALAVAASGCEPTVRARAADGAVTSVAHESMKTFEDQKTRERIAAILTTPEVKRTMHELSAEMARGAVDGLPSNARFDELVRKLTQTVVVALMEEAKNLGPSMLTPANEEAVRRLGSAMTTSMIRATAEQLPESLAPAMREALVEQLGPGLAEVVKSQNFKAALVETTHEVAREAVLGSNEGLAELGERRGRQAGGMPLGAVGAFFSRRTWLLALLIATAVFTAPLAWLVRERRALRRYRDDAERRTARAGALLAALEAEPGKGLSSAVLKQLRHQLSEDTRSRSPDSESPRRRPRHARV